MIQLQTKTIEQNEQFLDFIIASVDGQLKSMAEDVKQSTKDTHDRWIGFVKTFQQSHAEVVLLRMEVTRMADNMNALEGKINVLSQRVADKVQAIESSSEALSVKLSRVHEIVIQSAEMGQQQAAQS